MFQAFPLLLLQFRENGCSETRERQNGGGGGSGDAPVTKGRVKEDDHRRIGIFTALTLCG